MEFAESSSSFIGTGHLQYKIALLVPPSMDLSGTFFNVYQSTIIQKLCERRQLLKLCICNLFF